MDVVVLVNKCSANIPATHARTHTHTEYSRDEMRDLMFSFVTQTPQFFRHHDWEKIARERTTLKRWAARFITVYTTASHLSLSWVRSIQTTLSDPISTKSILIFSPIYVQVFKVFSIPHVCPPKYCTHLFSPPYVTTSCPSNSSWLMNRIISN